VLQESGFKFSTSRGVEKSYKLELSERDMHAFSGGNLQGSDCGDSEFGDI